MRDSLGSHAPQRYWALDLLLGLLCAGLFWLIVGYLAYWALAWWGWA